VSNQIRARPKQLRWLLRFCAKTVLDNFRIRLDALDNSIRSKREVTQSQIEQRSPAMTVE
jgi:hypothetical protein